MNKINVLVNDVLDYIGSVTARNVLKMSDMNLIPVSITSCGVYRKTKINQTSIDLIDPSQVDDDLVPSSSLLVHGRPDVVVDFSLKSYFKSRIPAYLDSKTSYILRSNGSDDEEKMTKLIKGLGVNVIFMSVKSSEQEVLSAIRFLYEKNEQKTFSQVFALADINI